MSFAGTFCASESGKSGGGPASLLGPCGGGAAPRGAGLSCGSRANQWAAAGGRGPAGGLGAGNRNYRGSTAPCFPPPRGSNATFRMQRRARPVCSQSPGPGAGSRLASVSEIRTRGANTRRPPQSPGLDSARGGAGPAVTRPAGGLGSGTRSPGRFHAGEMVDVCLPSSLINFAPLFYKDLARGGPTPPKNWVGTKDQDRGLRRGRGRGRRRRHILAGFPFLLSSHTPSPPNPRLYLIPYLPGGGQ
jgi:hypothetical protein